MTTVDWLPTSGALLFFYDLDEQPWGFDPKDKGCCAVVHVPDLEQPLAAQAGGGDGRTFPERNVEFRAIAVLPSIERPCVEALNLSDEEQEQYFDLLDAPFQGLPKSQVAGFPAPQQDDQMELECQLVSSGLYCGDGSGFGHPRAKALAPGAADWRLLLQLDSDDEVMWGDCGSLYFWIRAEEAAAGDFQNPWLILQCG